MALDDRRPPSPEKRKTTEWDDTEKPIHRVHESNRPLRPDKADPYGMQARWAIARYPVCPLKSLAAGNKDRDAGELEEGNKQKSVEERVDKACETIWEAMSQVMAQKDAGKTPTQKDLPFKNVDQKVAEKLLDRFSAHMGQDSDKELEELMRNTEKRDKAFRLMTMASIYGELSAIDLAVVRRCAAYPRLVSTEELDGKPPVRRSAQEEESQAASSSSARKPVKPLKTDGYIKAKYVIYPMALFFFCFALQSFLLHVTTALYVRYMERIEKDLKDVSDNAIKLSNVEGGEMFDLVSHLFVATEGAGEGEAVRDGNLKVPMFILDLSGLIPAGLCALTFAVSAYYDRFHIGLWYKTFLVACCMAIMKGVLDLVTVLPDSIGWQQCQTRLGDAALKHLESRQWFTNFWRTLWEAMIDEVIGVEGKRMRYCADMMVSGHTYFAALFSLAAYKLTGAVDFTRWAQRVVAVVCILCLLLEMVLVAAARFHYTVDMLVSIILVCLLWDSLRLEQWASDLSEGFNWRDPEWSQPGSWRSLFRLETVPPPGDEAGEPRVLASQPTHLINMRMLSGRAAWAIDDPFAAPTELTYTNQAESDGSQGSWRCCADDQTPLIRSSAFK